MRGIEVVDVRVEIVLGLRGLAQTMGREAAALERGGQRAALELAAAEVARVSLVLERVFQVEVDVPPVHCTCVGTP
jgi:hypothetical protein